MRRRIYFAAPLHKEEDKARNSKLVANLRAAGYSVYLPQEHGVWEDLLDKGMSKDEVRRMLYRLDIDAMHKCDTCIVCCGDSANPRAPSEGAMFEMGYMKASHKTVLLFNEDNYWHYNLMPQFGADETFEDWQSVLNYLQAQDKED